LPKLFFKIEKTRQTKSCQTDMTRYDTGQLDMAGFPAPNYLSIDRSIRWVRWMKGGLSLHSPPETPVLSVLDGEIGWMISFWLDLSSSVLRQSSTMQECEWYNRPQWIWCSLRECPSNENRLYPLHHFLSECLFFSSISDRHKDFLNFRSTNSSSPQFLIESHCLLQSHMTHEDARSDSWNLRYSQISGHFRHSHNAHKIQFTNFGSPAGILSFLAAQVTVICLWARQIEKWIEWNIGLSCSNFEKFVIWSVFVFMFVLRSHFSDGFAYSELLPTISHHYLLFITIICFFFRFPLSILWTLNVICTDQPWLSTTFPVAFVKSGRAGTKVRSGLSRPGRPGRSFFWAGRSRKSDVRPRWAGPIGAAWKSRFYHRRSLLPCVEEKTNWRETEKKSHETVKSVSILLISG
jgi:hypothetical protein